MRTRGRSVSAGSLDGAEPVRSRARLKTIGAVNERQSARVALAWIQGCAREASVAALAPSVRVVSRLLDPDLLTSGQCRPGLVFPGPSGPVPRPETERPPVLLVHGLGGTTSGLFALTQALRAIGLTVAAISYRSFGTSLEQLGEELAHAVRRLQLETGAARVHLVGHSLGGVVIAQAFADGLLTGRVESVVTVAAPFGGSPWAYVLPVGGVVRALRRGSPQLRRLATLNAPQDVRWLAVTAGVDRIVPGRRSLPTHAEVDTVEVDGAGHTRLLQNAQVISQVVNAIVAGPQPERAVA